MADTSTYVGGSFVRPPIIFYVWSMSGWLGSALQLHTLSFVQGVAGACAAAALATRIVELVRCAPAVDVVLAGLLFFPQLQSAVTISSESLAYTFFLLFFACVSDLLLATSRNRATLLALLSGGLCYQCRPQFVYLLPLALLSLVVSIVFSKARRERLTLLLGAGAIVAGLTGVQAAYNLPRTGKVGGVSMAGLQLLTVVGYLAADADIAQMSSGPARDFAVALHRRIVAQGLSADTPRRLNASWHFDAAYNIIVGQLFAAFNETVAHKSIGNESGDAEGLAATRGLQSATSECIGDLYCPVIETRSPRARLERALDADDWRVLDKLAFKTSFQLMRALKVRYLVFVIRMVYEHAHYWLFLTAATGALGTAKAIARGSPHEVRRAGFVVSFVAILWLANAFLVASVEVVQTRYLFYTDSLLLAVVFAVVSRGLTPSPTLTEV